MKTVKEKGLGVSVFRSEEGKEIIREHYEKILAVWPVPHERLYVQAGEMKTHVIVSGPETASPMILLHGTMSNSAAWMGDIELWSEHFRVIAADLPGEPGFSSEYRLSPAGDDYSDWLAALVNDLGYGGTAVRLVGQSLGSFAALKYAVNHTERAANISMLTTPAVAPQKVSFMLKALPLMLLGKWGHERIEKMIAYGVDTGPEAASFGRLVSKHCRPLYEPIPLFSNGELERLTMPVQYFGGDHDVMLNTEATAARIGEFVPGAEVNILQGIGHVVIGRTEEILGFMRG